MRRLLWTFALWPGFASAWVGGRWTGLILAVAFAAALNAALMSAFIRPLGPDAWTMTLWLAVVGLAASGLVWLKRDLSQLGGRSQPDPSTQLETWFCLAQQEYLKGH